MLASCSTCRLLMISVPLIAESTWFHPHVMVFCNYFYVILIFNHTIYFVQITLCSLSLTTNQHLDFNQFVEHIKH